MVGLCLGYDVFLPSDKILNLCNLLISLDQKYERKQFRKVCELSKEIKVAGLILSISFLTKALIMNQIC